MNEFAFIVWSKFFIFDHIESANLRSLAEIKKVCVKFFICCKIHNNVSENHQKVMKMSREKLVIFALDPKLDWATMILVLTSAPKFLWSVVHFDK